ncbi:glycosyltransferase family 9 protein [Mucilaginibacter aquaedulcis]|uniref:glycosyltransferase family 9 protein n=1 Tax=Mucilaginibacter aquaedulcis TaxID=1187081 RepID=UPI0025B41164|nr:glycosyltransferase family 9 protein [Mucilaginibacter aquaedulcis]MDN3548729.1 glycosyltransferase family 9 protein [Mucilaginibacter aquaedulcis]
MRKIIPVFVRTIYFFAPIQRKSLLIIKNDGIGDYILFRNYLKAIRESQRFSGWKIYLLTTPACGNFVQNLDAKYIDGCFWYEDDFFLKWKLVSLLFQLNHLRLNTIFYPSYSRKFSVDWLIRYVKALVKIGVDGDTVNEPAELKLKTDTYYTSLIFTKKEVVHEFERNKQIVEYLIGPVSNFSRPAIETTTQISKQSNYIVVFCGASNFTRRWDPAKFQNLCRQLIEEMGVHVILTGGKDEIAASKKITDGLPCTFFSNETGQYSLIQICELITGARLLITGDTVAVHIAASVQTPAICISKGNHYGRFVPYPKEIFDQLRVVLPPDFQPNKQYYDSWSEHDINEIGVQQVLSAARSHLINPVL